MWWLLLVLLLPFAYVLIKGAPYVPTKAKPLKSFLKQLHVQPGQQLVDLGSGDGQVLKVAARDFGMRVSGVEFNPFLVLVAKLRLIRYRSVATIKLGDVWKTSLPDDVDYIFIFTMPRFIDRMEAKIRQSIDSEVVVISYAFEFTNHKPILEADGLRAYRFKPLD